MQIIVLVSATSFLWFKKIRRSQMPFDSVPNPNAKILGEIAAIWYIDPRMADYPDTFLNLTSIWFTGPSSFCMVVKKKALCSKYLAGVNNIFKMILIHIIDRQVVFPLTRSCMRKKRIILHIFRTIMTMCQI